MKLESIVGFIKTVINSIYFLAIAFLAVTLIFFYTQADVIDGTDIARIISLKSLIYVLISPLVVLLLIKLNKLNFKLKHLIIASIILKLLFFSIFALKEYYDVTFYYDYFAGNILKHGFSFIGYGFNFLTYYYYNLPLVFYYLFLQGVFGHDLGLIVGGLLNVCYLIILEIYVYRLVKLIYNQKAALNAYVLMLLAFPLYGIMLVVYNDVPFLMLTFVASFYLVKGAKEKSLGLSLLGFLILTIDAYARSNAMIILISFFIYFLLLDFKKVYKFILIILIMYISNMPSFLDKVYDKFGVYNSAGVSHASYLVKLAVGLSDGVDNQTPGYFYPFDEKTYQLLNDGVLDEQAFNKYLITYIKTRVNDLGPVGLGEHFLKKHLINWGDGLFEANVYTSFTRNYKEEFAYEFNNPLRSVFIHSDILRFTIEFFNRSLYWIYLVVTSAYCFKNFKKLTLEETLLALFVLGTMCLNGLFETSPHYNIIGFVVLIIFTSNQLNNLKPLKS